MKSERWINLLKKNRPQRANSIRSDFIFNEMSCCVPQSRYGLTVENDLWAEQIVLALNRALIQYFFCAATSYWFERQKRTVIKCAWRELVATNKNNFVAIQIMRSRLKISSFFKKYLAHSVRDKFAQTNNKVAIDYGRSFCCRNLFIASGYISTHQ